MLFLLTVISSLFLAAADSGWAQTNPAGTGEQNDRAPTTETSETANVSWSGYFGTLTRKGSGQYDNAVLQVKSLDDMVVLFEIDMMEGSESEDQARSLKISGTMLIGDDGKGLYEHPKEEGGTAYSVRFNRSEDGQQMAVTHTGEIPMNPDGDYEWIDSEIESDPDLATALLEHLPAVATSLNGNVGAYTINYPEESLLDYFYQVTATLDDTGAKLAEYLVCADLSAIWRLDTEDGLPVLIYGTAQDMLDRTVYPKSDDASGDDATGETDQGAMPLLGVVLEGGTILKSGANAKLRLDSPYPFPCSFYQPLSVNDEVATVSEDGTVTAHNAGKTIITANVVVDGSKRGFMLEITVVK
jgi:hypothetical protein